MTVSATPGLIVARDLELVAWLDRLVGASVEQIRARFGLGRTQAYRRLQVLQDFGLVRRRHLSATLPPLYTVPSRSLRVASCEHAHALTELVVAIETSGGEIATELELRREREARRSSTAGSPTEQLATVLGCPRIPDAVELLAGGGLRAYRGRAFEQGPRPAGSRSSPPMPSPTTSASTGSRPTRSFAACSRRDRRARPDRLHGGERWTRTDPQLTASREEMVAKAVGALVGGLPLPLRLPQSFGAAVGVGRRRHSSVEHRRATTSAATGARSPAGRSPPGSPSPPPTPCSTRRSQPTSSCGASSASWNFGHLDPGGVGRPPVGVASARLGGGAGRLWRLSDPGRPTADDAASGVSSPRPAWSSASSARWRRFAS